MQNNDKKLEEKSTKTLQLVALANVLLSPLYLLDSKLGITAFFTTNAFLLYHFHELGKRRRPGSNTLNQINTFFASQTNSQSLGVDNALRNIVNGGDAIYNELSTALKK